VGRLFFRCYTDALHIGGKNGDRDGDPILHQHLGGIEIGAELKRDAQRHVAIARTLGRPVEHVLNAVDLLLDRRRNRFRYHLRVGAGIGGRDLDRWWRNVGILGNWKRQKRNHADERDDDADDAGKDRPVDEEVRKVHSVSASAWLGVILDFGMEWRSASPPVQLMLLPAQAYLSFPVAAAAGAWRQLSPHL